MEKNRYSLKILVVIWRKSSKIFGDETLFYTTKGGAKLFYVPRGGQYYAERPVLSPGQYVQPSSRLKCNLKYELSSVWTWPCMAAIIGTNWKIETT